MAAMRSLLASSLVAVANGENGIARVLSMMGEMKSKAEAEAQEEAVKFKGFQTWCSSTTTQLKAQIEKLGEEISESKSIITAQSAKAQEMGDKSAKNAAEITALTKERTAKKEARAADKNLGENTVRSAVFVTVKADYETSIGAIEKAITVLKSQPKTVSQGSALAQIESSSMSKAQKSLISLLVTQGPKGHAYENQSGGVIGMLEDLKSQFISELQAEAVAETKKAGATNTILMSLSGQIENLEEEKKRFDGAKAKHLKMAAEAQAELEGDQATLAVDKKSLTEVSTNCAKKEEEYAARTSLRAGELEALQQAIDVIQGIADKKTAAGLVQTSFLQLAHSKSDIQKVAAYLQKEGASMGSKRLQLVALKATAGGSFDKIMKMIEDTIERLKAEALEESGKHGQCMVWMSENKSDLETSTERKDELAATIDEQTGIAGTTAQKIKDLSQAESDAVAAMTEATKVRNDEKATNAQTVADAKEGEDAVDQALQILTEFYGKAAQATALIQDGQAPIDASGAPETFDTSFKGNQGGGSDVINMLEVIQADFLKLRTETESSEAANQKAYDEFMNEQELAKASRDSNLTHAKEANAAAKAAKAAAEKDLAGQEKVHSGLVEQKRVIEQDKGCIALSSKTPDELFKERMEARDNEIESLRNALEMLK